MAGDSRSGFVQARRFGAGWNESRGATWRIWRRSGGLAAASGAAPRAAVALPILHVRGDRRSRSDPSHPRVVRAQQRLVPAGFGHPGRLGVRRCLPLPRRVSGRAGRFLPARVGLVVVGAADVGPARRRRSVATGSPRPPSRPLGPTTRWRVCGCHGCPSPRPARRRRWLSRSDLRSVRPDRSRLVGSGCLLRTGLPALPVWRPVTINVRSVERPVSE